MAVIQDLGEIQLTDARVRGVLAGSFLEHFGLLIDYDRRKKARAAYAINLKQFLGFPNWTAFLEQQ